MVYEPPPSLAQRFSTLHNLERHDLAGGDDGYPCLLIIPHTLEVESRVVEILGADLDLLVLSSSELVRAAESPGRRKV